MIGFLIWIIVALILLIVIWYLLGMTPLTQQWKVIVMLLIVAVVLLGMWAYAPFPELSVQRRL